MKSTEVKELKQLACKTDNCSLKKSIEEKIKKLNKDNTVNKDGESAEI